VGPAELREALAPVFDDVLRAGNVAADGVEQLDGPSPDGERFVVTVELAEEMES
jgi:hypothetical protein